MRKLLFKNRISPNKKRKELFMSEHLEDNGVSQDFEKRIIYAVQQVFEYKDKKDLEDFINTKVSKDLEPETFIVKERCTKDKTERVIHKVTGLQYVVLKEKVVVLKILQVIKRTIRIQSKKVIPSP